VIEDFDAAKELTAGESSGLYVAGNSYCLNLLFNEHVFWTSEEGWEEVEQADDEVLPGESQDFKKLLCDMVEKYAKELLAMVEEVRNPKE